MNKDITPLPGGDFTVKDQDEPKTELPAVKSSATLKCTDDGAGRAAKAALDSSFGGSGKYK